MENKLPELNSDQKRCMREIIEWAEDRDPRKGDYKYAKRKNKVDEDLNEALVGDNPDDYWVLRGPAGTGKTYLLAELITELSRRGWIMAVTAPTNKAVGVIQEKVRQQAGNRVLAAGFSSVHSVVGLRMVETDDGEVKISLSGESRLGEYQLMIVDEGSMVDTAMQLKGIVRGRGNCLVLFVGDDAQLPPVSEGGVSPIFRLPQQSRLTEITRQAAGNPLIVASAHVREFQAMERDVHVSDLMSWLPDCMVKNPGGIADDVFEYQKNGWDARALAYTNRKVLSINQDVHYLMHPESADMNMLFCEGQRLICQSQVYGRDISTGESVQLQNSEEVIILEVVREEHPHYPDVRVYTMIVEDDLGANILIHVPLVMARFHSKCAELFDEVKHAHSRGKYEEVKAARQRAWLFKKSFADMRHTYAHTGHKIQGSTIDYAFVHMPDLQGMKTTFDRNRGLYVMMTRPRHKAFFYY